VFADNDGNIPPERLDLYRALTATDRPDTVAAWLDRGGAPGILRQLDEAGLTALSHKALEPTTRWQGPSNISVACWSRSAFCRTATNA
jgi:hypothetical protein